MLEYELRVVKEDLRDARAAGGTQAEEDEGVGKAGEGEVSEEDLITLDGMVQGYLRGRGYKMSAVQMGVERVGGRGGGESGGLGGENGGRRLEDVYRFKVRDVEEKERQMKELEGARETAISLEGRIQALKAELESVKDASKVLEGRIREEEVKREEIVEANEREVEELSKELKAVRLEGKGEGEERAGKQIWPGNREDNVMASVLSRR